MLLSLNIAGMSFSGGTFSNLSRSLLLMTQPMLVDSLVIPHRNSWYDGIKPAPSCHSSEPTRTSILKGENRISLMNLSGDTLGTQ